MLTIVLQPPFGGHHDMSNKWYKCNDMYIKQLYWFSNQVNQSFHFTFKHLESLKTIISLGRSYPVFTTDLKPTGQTMIFKIYDTSPRSKIQKPWNIRKKTNHTQTHMNFELLMNIKIRIEHIELNQSTVAKTIPLPGPSKGCQMDGSHGAIFRNPLRFWKTPPIGGCWLKKIRKYDDLWSSWWFQPIWNILVKLDHFPK